MEAKNPNSNHSNSGYQVRNPADVTARKSNSKQGSSPYDSNTTVNTRRARRQQRKKDQTKTYEPKVQSNQVVVSSVPQDPFTLHQSLGEVKRLVSSAQDKFNLARLQPGVSKAPYVLSNSILTVGQGIVKSNFALPASSTEFTLITYAPVAGSLKNCCGFGVSQQATAAACSIDLAQAFPASWQPVYTSGPPPTLGGVLIWSAGIALTFEGAAATMGGSVYMGWVPVGSVSGTNAITYSNVTSFLTRIPIVPGREYSMRTCVQDPSIITHASYSAGHSNTIAEAEHILVYAIHQPAYSITSGTGVNATINISTSANYASQSSISDVWIRGLLPEPPSANINKSILPQEFTALISSTHRAVKDEDRLLACLEQDLQNVSCVLAVNTTLSQPSKQTEYRLQSDKYRYSDADAIREQNSNALQGGITLSELRERNKNRIRPPFCLPTQLEAIGMKLKVSYSGDDVMLGDIPIDSVFRLERYQDILEDELPMKVLRRLCDMLYTRENTFADHDADQSLSEEGTSTSKQQPEEEEPRPLGSVAKRI